MGGNPQVVGQVVHDVALRDLAVLGLLRAQLREEVGAPAVLLGLGLLVVAADFFFGDLCTLSSTNRGRANSIRRKGNLHP